MKSKFLFPLVLLAAQTAILSEEAPALRFQLLSAKAFGAEGLVRDIVFRIDTTTGETWERVEATVSNQIVLMWIKIPEMNVPDRTELNEGKKALAWALSNPGGGIFSGKHYDADQVALIKTGSINEIRRLELLIPEPQRTMK